MLPFVVLSRFFSASINPLGSSTNPNGTISGHKGLSMNEPLLFELDKPGRVGVNINSGDEFDSSLPDHSSPFLGAAAKSKGETIGLPSVTENRILRHYVRISQKNFNIESGFYPLGSCSMKYNPRINETIARFPGFAHAHPLQPESTLSGSKAVFEQLGEWLIKLTGMSSVTFAPAAGAHGEYAGILAIRQALRADGTLAQKDTLLIPKSAHGTNPSTAACAGFKIKEIQVTKDGLVDLEDFEANLGDNIAGLMLTNPSTVGLFEPDIKTIADKLHKKGAYFYLDGANFNALLGRVKIDDLGVDCMHINLHKTFSTPHGGGGPGAGPVVLSHRLKNFAPIPLVERKGDNFEFINKRLSNQSVGRIKAFDGQMGMFTRALAYCKALGASGLKQVSGDSVLNANYLLSKLRTDLTPAYPNQKYTMHEAIFSDQYLKGTGVTTLDMAKALLDEGFHPPTVYFPLVVSGALLMEPTETESKASLDLFIKSLSTLAQKAKLNDPDIIEAFHQAPRFTPVRRCDEVTASRKPIITFEG